jgi:hypothetical protein
MNRVKTFFNCVSDKIKKKFFKAEKTDLSHACEELKKMTKETASEYDLNLLEEYTKRYISTTRWQTV